MRSLLCIGSQRLWVGLACGNVRVYDLSDKPHLLAHWHAHDAAVVSAVQAGPRVYTLGRDGSIRGWSAALPGADDSAARSVDNAADANVVCADRCPCLSSEQAPPSASGVCSRMCIALDPHLSAALTSTPLLCDAAMNDGDGSFCRKIRI